jgi:hypothetical protein
MQNPASAENNVDVYVDGMDGVTYFELILRYAFKNGTTD